MNRLSFIEEGLKKEKPLSVRVGDTVRVYAKVTEGEKVRTQVFEGTVIARKGSGNRQTFSVRKISFGVGVEKTFPIHSPTLEKIEVVRQGRVRRAKLYYLRNLKGRAARIVEERPKFKGRKAEVVAPVAEEPEEAETVPAETT